MQRSVRTFSRFIRHGIVPAGRRRFAAPTKSHVCLQRTDIHSCSASRSDVKAPESTPETHSFQAETRRVLDIMTNALYTDRHIFVRELVSNASDALEKVRHMYVAGDDVAENDAELGIKVFTNESEGTLTIQDTGVGLTKDELKQNLGTIAFSGSKAFLQEMQAQGQGSDTASNIIGQFGVGFYSAFMVADKVQVFTKSAKPGQEGWCWTSAGDGTYTIEPAPEAERGSRIVLHLKDTAKEFASAKTVQDVIEKYSNFVAFPIKLNDEVVNTVQAIWTMSKQDVSEQQYDDFFKFKTKRRHGEQMYRLHFASDAPIELKGLFYIAEMHDEAFGLGRQSPGVDLYSRKVLIEPESRVLPEWLRFVHGVVDSEDIPLHISRESMQDTAMMMRIKSVLTRRILRFLEQEMRKDRKQYQSFFQEYGNFLKEGICSDAAYQSDIARLMLFESSALPAGELTTLDEYISRAKPGQEKIIYLVAPHRGLAEASPYMEAFRGSEDNDFQDTEVLFAYASLDDFVFNNLARYNGRELVTAESGDVGLPSKSKEQKDKEEAENEEDAAEDGSAPRRLSDQQVGELGLWLMQTALPSRLKEVKASSRLRSTPAVVVDHESASVRRMMRMMDQARARDGESPKSEEHMLPKQTLEVNPSHPIVRQLWAMREQQPDLATGVAQQIFDNALVAAGLLDDPRTMLPRLNQLLEALMTTRAGEGSGDASVSKDAAGVGKRFVPDKEASYRQEMQAVSESMGGIEKELNDPEVLKAARAAGVNVDGAADDAPPKQFVVGPDGKLVEQEADTESPAMEAEVIRDEGRQ